MNSEKKLEELIWEMPDKLREMGLSMSKIGEYMRGYSWVLNFNKERGTEYFERDIVTQYVRRIEERNERGEISKMLYQNHLRAAQHITEYHDTGKFEWTMRGNAAVVLLNIARSEKKIVVTVGTKNDVRIWRCGEDKMP